MRRAVPAAAGLDAIATSMDQCDAMGNGHSTRVQGSALNGFASDAPRLSLGCSRSPTEPTASARSGGPGSAPARGEKDPRPPMSRPRSMHDRMRSEKKRSKHCGQRAASTSFASTCASVAALEPTAAAGIAHRDCPQGLPTGKCTAVSTGTAACMPSSPGPRRRRWSTARAGRRGWRR